MSPDDGSDADDAVVGAVRSAVHAYEDALVAGDVAAATGFFETGADVSRFGPDGAQLGPAAVGAARAAQGPQPPPGWILDEIRTLSSDIVLHLAVLDRDGIAILRSQVWRRGEKGWRIAHAHVTRSTEPVEVRG